MFKKISALGLGAFAASVAAHGYIPGFVTDGKWNQGFLLDYYYQKVNTGSFPNIAAWYSENLDSGFVAPDAFQTSDINCHKNSAPGVLSGTVAAGGTVTFQWTTWPHNLGPVLTYVARCSGDCSAADKNSLRWVKIEAVGINYATQVWASQTLMNNNNTWTTRVPSTLAPGNYVFRHEMIALHGAGSANGAQAYPFCINIKITGSGTDNPAGTLGKDLYKSNDPGILMNPYTSLTTYQMPGPSLYTGGGGGTPSTTTARTTSSTLTTTVRSSSTTTRSSASPTTSTGVCSPLYGQCGGSGYTGPTCCLAGTCKYSNDFYSQCLN